MDLIGISYDGGEAAACSQPIWVARPVCEPTSDVSDRRHSFGSPGRVALSLDRSSPCFQEGRKQPWRAPSILARDRQDQRSLTYSIVVTFRT